MPNALFAFEDRSAARRAAEALVGAGLPSGCVELHQHEGGPNDEMLQNVDEVVTGGLAHNFASLFQRLFEWNDSPHEPSDYAATIRRGGAVVSVDAADDGEQQIADRTMASANVGQRTGWSEPPRSLSEERDGGTGDQRRNERADG